MDTIVNGRVTQEGDGMLRISFDTPQRVPGFDWAMVLVLEQDGTRDKWGLAAKAVQVGGVNVASLDFVNESYAATSTASARDDEGGPRRLSIVKLDPSGTTSFRQRFRPSQVDREHDLEFYAVIVAVSLAGGIPVSHVGPIVATRSLRVGKDGNAARPVIYEHARYVGRSATLDVGRYDVARIALGNDTVSSVRVPPGWRVTLHRDAGFQGPTSALTADAATLPGIDDAASSIVVERGVGAASPHRVLIDAALEGINEYAGKVFFFLGGHYVRFDLATQRVDAGYPLPLDRWKLTGELATGVRAAVDGRLGYEGKAYFFRDGSYTRYDWRGDRIDDGYPLPLSQWDLVGSFREGIDAALDGRAAYDGKLYFFRGPQYVRYDWASGRIDPGFPAELSAWNLPYPFTTGIDATLDRTGPGGPEACFFLGDAYVTYDWTTGMAGAPRPIVAGFPGCVELLCVAEGARQALLWIGAALPWLRTTLQLAQEGLGQASSVQAKRLAALATHFHIDTAEQRKTHLGTVVTAFEAVAALLRSLPGHVVFHTDDVAWFPQSAAGVRDKDPYPGYASHGNPIAFTRTFANFGPLCQAAMVLHEGIHATLAHSPDSAYEHDRANYSALTVEQATHNPSSYVSFAQELYYGRDERYGAGRPNE